MNRWDDPAVESMYDKTLMAMESRLIAEHIPEGSSICDAGCGEGEGTLFYSQIPKSRVHAFDSSTTRLSLAAERLAGRANVSMAIRDIMEQGDDGMKFDVVVSQRLLINLDSKAKQRGAFSALVEMLNPGGLLILSEGSADGVENLNNFREHYGLAPIPVPAHNRFIKDEDLLGWGYAHGLGIVDKPSMGAYYLLTRGVQPALTNEYDWLSAFNIASASDAMSCDLPCAHAFARVKIWVFR